jgi:putative transport protein
MARIIHTAEFSYISILVMAAGFLLGAIPIPLPGLGKLVLGLAGVLIVAPVLGELRRTHGMNWTIPLSANFVLRNFGLTLFLAQVGMSSRAEVRDSSDGDGLADAWPRSLFVECNATSRPRDFPSIATPHIA